MDKSETEKTIKQLIDTMIQPVSTFEFSTPLYRIDSIIRPSRAACLKGCKPGDTLRITCAFTNQRQWVVNHALEMKVYRNGEFNGTCTQNRLELILEAFNLSVITEDQ